jgi:hypothetical protein
VEGGEEKLKDGGSALGVLYFLSWGNTHGHIIYWPLTIRFNQIMAKILLLKTMEASGLNSPNTEKTAESFRTSTVIFCISAHSEPAGS